MPGQALREWGFRSGTHRTGGWVAAELLPDAFDDGGGVVDVVAPGERKHPPSLGEELVDATPVSNERMLVQVVADTVELDGEAVGGPGEVDPSDESSMLIVDFVFEGGRGQERVNQ